LGVPELSIPRSEHVPVGGADTGGEPVRRSDTVLTQGVNRSE